MLYLTIDETNDLIREARGDAFHLEVSDDHSQVSDEAEPMRRVLAGLPPFEDDSYPSTWRAWEDLVSEVTGRGTNMRRVRVVSEPLTDYVRFLHGLTDRNQKYGEDIRWLPRHLAGPSDYTTDEWWLIDGEKVAFTIFGTDGDFVGAAVTIDPVIVARCVAVRDALWDRAIPHRDYSAGMPSE
ncbi:DUF6879 family protein [Nocardia sp. NPDC050710]|uniref:DUF6879 family protein n=1 Tax=Nocardia sp. NPDC050710 TaxID=3157220 RepID=UPI00340DE8F3